MKIRKVFEHFKKYDPIIYSVAIKVKDIEELKPRHPEKHFFSLTREIINQQLSDKAGETIFSRFLNLFPGKKVTPEKVLEIPHEVFRTAGPSNAKIKFIKDLAEKVVKKELDFAEFLTLDDETVLKEITKVKGIGSWTAEMYLMFTLGREDVFSHGDAGLQKALRNLYKLKKPAPEEKINKIVSKWSPYKTYGCMLLWRSLDI